MRACFTDCDLTQLTTEQRCFLEIWCRSEGRCSLWEPDGDLVHIDLECNLDPCRCAAVLASWREDCWSKSRETRRG